MKLNRTGVTRLVIELDTVVIKMPNFTYSWLNFLTGLLANINERNTWRWNSGKYESGRSHYLCPVLYGTWTGLFLVMKKADRVLTQSEAELAHYHECIKYFGGDDKPNNYGWLGDRVVKLDYGSRGPVTDPYNSETWGA